VRKHNQIHTLGALHYKMHLRVLRKLKDLSMPYGLKITVLWNLDIIGKYRQNPCRAMKVQHGRTIPQILYFTWLLIIVSNACHAFVFMIFIYPSQSVTATTHSNDEAYYHLFYENKNRLW